MGDVKEVKPVEARMQRNFDSCMEVFKNLSDLSDSDLKLFLGVLFSNPLGSPNDKYQEVLDNGKIKRIIMDGNPDSIVISYYSSIEINVYGIRYMPEHGESIQIVHFSHIARYIRRFGHTHIMEETNDDLPF